MISDTKKIKLNEDINAAYKIKSKNLFKGMMYLFATMGMLLLNTPSMRPYRDSFIMRSSERVVKTFHKTSLPEGKISKTLNLEGQIAKSADNLVRISTAEGVGCGVFVSPYEIYTANHVVEQALKSKGDIYIQSQSYLGSKESIVMRLDSNNYQYNKNDDLGKIVLDVPVYAATKLTIRKTPDFDKDPNIVSIAYKDRVVFHQMGKVVNQMYYGKYYIGNINVGPGISGSPIFKEDGSLVGITSMMIASREPQTKYDNGPIIFTSVANPFTNK